MFSGRVFDANVDSAGPAKEIVTARIIGGCSKIEGLCEMKNDFRDGAEGQTKKRASMAYRGPEVPLLGEDETIYRALQIASWRAERQQQEGRLKSDAVSDIRALMGAVDGRQPVKDYLEREERIAENHQLPEALRLEGIIQEMRTLMEVGTLGRNGNVRRLFRTIPGLTRLDKPDIVLKAMCFFKGRMLWGTLRYLKDPDDPRNADWPSKICLDAEIVVRGALTYLDKSTVFDAKRVLLEWVRHEQERGESPIDRTLEPGA